MDGVKWQLPVKQSNTTDVDWVHPKAKFHAFVKNYSVCGRHWQEQNYFTTDLEQPLSKDLACHKCLKKLNLLQE